MSDPTATDSITSSRFLSLKWKSAVTLLCILTALFLLLAWHYYEQYQRNFQTRLAGLRLQQLEALEETVYRSAEVLHHLIDSVVIDGPNEDTQDEISLTRNRQRMLDSLPKIRQLWQLDEALLVDADNQVLGQLPGNSDQSQPLKSWLTHYGVEKLSSTPSSLLCFSSCIQVLNFPIIDGNTQVATLVVSRRLRALVRDFRTRADTHLLLFGNDTLLEQSPLTVDSNPALKIPSWHGQLAMPASDDRYKEVLYVASKRFDLSALLGTSKSFDHAGRTYAISVVPIRDYEDLRWRYILLSEVSSERSAIIDTMRQDALVIFCAVAVLAVYLTVSSMRHFFRVKQQIALLPMFGQNQFSEVRDLVRKNRRHTLFRDELDLLDEAVTDFSYQLESLEKAVNVRTREMERLSLFDPLTGLANRNLLQYELQSDVHRYYQQGGVLGVVILDLDKFKRINDSLGHQLGDMLLGKIGARLKNATRSLGLVARLGGDEFAIILRSAKKVGQTEVLCQKIIELIRRPLELDNHSISISCSMGLALAGNNQSGDDMIKNAEIAMYKAKESGGNACRMFNPNMATEAHANLSLEADIRRAFDNKEFTLFLQPKVNMESEIMGFESLIRWDHPDRGLVPPGEFIPAMENMGLISHLDNFVLDASCRQLKVLQTHYPQISIAVNISSTHFTDKNFLLYLKNCLDRHPIDPSRLELEITETLLMENMSVGLEIIEQIKELGVSIAIDDFGTGYSSLSYLKKLPVDTIKIDREFIKDIPESESDMQISSVIIFLAKQLNFTVVAEGVETSKQLVFLKANQCDLAQGYLFSKPIPAHKAMLLLESRSGGQKLGIA